MRLRRTLPIVLAVVLIAALLVLAVQLRKHAPPEAARLLPTADGFLYADYSWVRKANNGKPFYPVTHDAEYEQFIQQTGFDFERDLDSVAFAIHYPKDWPGGGTGSAASEPRFSEVFLGHFDADKCTAYFKKVATASENYNSVDIYTIPIYNRTFRIAILGVDTVAASNHEDPGVIRGMVDRSRRLASPFGGPAFLRRYYKFVQLGSPVWLMLRIEPSAPGFDGWSTVFSRPADLVVSASFNPLHLPLRSGVLHLLAEAWALNDEDAQAITDKLNAFLTMFHSAEASVGSPGTDADVKEFFDSLQVRQVDNRAIIRAAVPTEVIRKLADSPSQIPALASPPVQESPKAPVQKQPKTPRRRR
ncbi:MAG TPA: hypothetical protein VGS27_14850 [Candidatus Sulfotelmatobacter sp.]|nr:hypothetical protein [Candidatus Sulfotelmatobacter sp.]